jgi:hypothetical protein
MAAIGKKAFAAHAVHKFWGKTQRPIACSNAGPRAAELWGSFFEMLFQIRCDFGKRLAAAFLLVEVLECCPIPPAC